MVTHVALLFLPALVLIGASVLARTLGEDIARRLTRAGLVAGVLCGLIGVGLGLTDATLADINGVGAGVLVLGGLITLLRLRNREQWESVRVWSGTTACAAVAVTLLLEPNASIIGICIGAALAFAGVSFGAILRFVDPAPTTVGHLSRPLSPAQPPADDISPSSMPAAPATRVQPLSSPTTPGADDPLARFGPLPPMFDDDEEEAPRRAFGPPAPSVPPSTPELADPPADGDPLVTPAAAAPLDPPVATPAISSGFRMRQRSAPLDSVEQARRR